MPGRPPELAILLDEFFKPRDRAFIRLSRLDGTMRLTAHPPVLRKLVSKHRLLEMRRLHPPARC